MRIFITLLICLISGSSFAQKMNSLEIGTKTDITTFQIINAINGQPLSFQSNDQHEGTLLIFTCNTCPYVLKSMPRMQKVLKKAEELKINVIILNPNEAQREEEDHPQKMIEFAQKYKFPNYYIDLHHNVADYFGATRTPEVFLTNNENILIYKGAMDDNVQEPENAKELFLENAMEQLAKNNLPEVTETKSIGCTIKRLEK